MEKMNNPYVKTLEPVWKKLEHVFINEKKLQELIEKMKKEELKTPAWAVPNVHPPIDCKTAEWIDFVCWINTINFAFTNFYPPYPKFTIEYPQGTFWSGAFALQASFIRAQREGIPVFDANFMANITQNQMEYIFRPVPGCSLPMLRERREILQEIGRVLIERFDKSFVNLFVEANWRAFNDNRGIVELLIRFFPSFRDNRVYKGYFLEFNKRAQLLVMMYHGRAVNSEGRMPLIRDIKDIGPIADYDVPKALRLLGVLEYSSEMERAIQSYEIIQPGDPREIENRLATCYVMKRICDEVGITMDKADAYVWFLGKESDQPHIMVPTTDY